MPERFDELAAEIDRARAKYPGRDGRVAALLGETNEMLHAFSEGRLDDGRAEALQVAATAWRIVEEGDESYEAPATLEAVRRILGEGRAEYYVGENADWIHELYGAAGVEDPLL